MLALKIHVPKDIIIDDREAAVAAGRGVSNIVKRHLVDRDRRGRSDGLPRTGYYGDARVVAWMDAFYNVPSKWERAAGGEEAQA